MPDDADRWRGDRLGQFMQLWPAETEFLATSHGRDAGVDDGPRSLRLRLARLGTGAVVGLVLAVNLQILGYTGALVGALAILVGVLSMWDARTPPEIVETGLSLTLTLLAMLPVTYYLPSFIGAGDGWLVVAAVGLWIAIAAILSRVLRHVIDGGNY